MIIGFLGFGEAGQAFAKTLGGELVAYDVKGDALAGPADALNTRLGGPAILSQASIVFSAVTAAVSLDAIQAVERHLHPGQTVIDINSVSPARKHTTANVVGAMGADYVDMAIMGPVHPLGHKTPVLVAGANESLRQWLTEKDFSYEVAGEEIGQATAIKLVRSLFVKGLEAITVATLRAADNANCRTQLETSLATSFPGLGWPGFADYETERVEKHGRRRAAEMNECAVAMQDLGLPEARDLALAVARVHEAFAKP